MIVFYYTWITRGIVSMFIMIFSFIKNLNFFMIPPQLISELIDNYEELNIILIQQSSVWYILLIVYTYLSFKLSFLWPLPLHFNGTWQYDTTSLVDIFSIWLQERIQRLNGINKYYIFIVRNERTWESWFIKLWRL